jgi:hypothetical protein
MGRRRVRDFCEKVMAGDDEWYMGASMSMPREAGTAQGGAGCRGAARRRAHGVKATGGGGKGGGGCGGGGGGGKVGGVWLQHGGNN